MATVEKITIALTPEMAGFVRKAVIAGEYASTSDVDLCLKRGLTL